MRDKQGVKQKKKLIGNKEEFFLLDLESKKNLWTIRKATYRFTATMQYRGSNINRLEKQNHASPTGLSKNETGIGQKRIETRAVLIL